MIVWKRILIIFLIIGGLLMALHDVDKKNDDRTVPVVASQDKVPADARLSHGTTQVSNKDEGSDPNGSVQVQESLIKSVDSDGNIVAMLGYQDGGFGASDFGFKVAQSGYSADTATDDQLVMSSAFNSFKIVDVVVVTNPGFSLNTGGAVWASTSSNYTYAHGLGYVPIVLGFGNISGGYWPLPIQFNIVSAGSPYWIKMALVADATNVTINSTIIGYNINVSYPSIDITLHFLRETAN